MKHLKSFVLLTTLAISPLSNAHDTWPENMIVKVFEFYPLATEALRSDIYNWQNLQHRAFAHDPTFNHSEWLVYYKAASSSEEFKKYTAMSSSDIMKLISLKNGISIQPTGPLSTFEKSSISVSSAINSEVYNSTTKSTFEKSSISISSAINSKIQSTFEKSK